MSNLILDSHNGAVSGEVWLYRSDGDTARSMKERVRLEFRSHNGSIRALVVRTPIPGENIFAWLTGGGSTFIRRWPNLVRSCK
jgi:hypothetical protein